MCVFNPAENEGSDRPGLCTPGHHSAAPRVCTFVVALLGCAGTFCLVTFSYQHVEKSIFSSIFLSHLACVRLFCTLTEGRAGQPDTLYSSYSLKRFIFKPYCEVKCIRADMGPVLFCSCHIVLQHLRGCFVPCGRTCGQRTPVPSTTQQMVLIHDDTIKPP